MNKLQGVLGARVLSVFLASVPAGLVSVEASRCSEIPRPLVCRELGEEFKSSKDPRAVELAQLELAEESLLRSRIESPERLAACFKWLGDRYRDLGSYRAEELYLRSVELAPRHPEILEGIAQYYRSFRGSKGLFAEAEGYYLRAESVLAEALLAVEDSTQQDYLLDLRERAVRGRIELNKREGLGIIVPGAESQELGLYLGFEREDGGFPVSHNDLVTPSLTLLGIDPSFDTRQMIRQQALERQRTRLRVRQGKRPFLDFAWSTVEGANVIAGQFLPATFFDIHIEEAEVAVEDVVGGAPYGDLLWRVELRSGTFDVPKLFREEFERLSASMTVTHNFGGVKADLEILGSVASVDTGNGSDQDILGAVNLRAVHFQPRSRSLHPIDPRGHEYAIGYVNRQRGFGENVVLVQETVYAGIELKEFARRSDLRILANLFRNEVRGVTGEDSSNLEANLILTHRIIDWVNNVKKRQGERAVGFAQWAFSIHLFEDFAVSTIRDFESRGLVLGSFIEFFSGPLNRSGGIVEGNYEVRDYPYLERKEEMFRIAYRIGF